MSTTSGNIGPGLEGFDFDDADEHTGTRRVPLSQLQQPSFGALDQMMAETPTEEVTPSEPSASTSPSESDDQSLDDKSMHQPSVNSMRLWVIGAILMFYVALGVVLTTVIHLSTTWLVVVLVLGGLIMLLVSLHVWDSQAEGRHQPPGLVPHKGAYGLLWKAAGKLLYGRFGWDWLLHRSVKDRWDQALQGVQELKHVQLIVGSTNTDGGSGKTFLTAWLVKTHAFAIKRHIGAMDVNENGGKTAKRLGIDRGNTILLRTFLERAKEALDFQQLTELIDWEPETGVSCIASEDDSAEPIDSADMRIGIRAYKSTAHAVYCDFGNGYKWPANMVSLEESDVVLIPAVADNDDTRESATATHDFYSSEPGQDIKMAHAISVIMGARWWQRKKLATEFPWAEDRIRFISYNRYMKRDRPALLTKVPLRVRTELMETLLLVLRTKLLNDKSAASPEESVAEPDVADVQAPHNPSSDEGVSAEALPERSSS